MFACVLSLTVTAQEHLTFKGIPIDGKLSTFINKLKSQGFSEKYTQEYSAILNGKFSGENCEVAVYASQNTKTVYKVVVVVEESNSWSSLKFTYKEFKSLLTSKYGKGSSYENFTSPYYDGDGYEMTALRTNRCTYFTEYNTNSGNISLIIGHLDEGAILLYYSDKFNSELAVQEESNLRISDL